ncbi:MAG: plasma membrane fusion protein prm1 [Chaenotheca gracillima]|nr:MAG: plasma membrane fusion protein prm1 [Chaenotheca gracillima]
MPVQRTFFGQSVSVPRWMPPRRILFVLITASLFTIGTLIFASSSQSLSSVPSVEDLADLSKHIDDHLPKSLPKISIPNFNNPLGPSAHTPPVQANSTSASGETKWHSTWKWLKNPFSSSLTLDENRAVLPPLRTRPPIYTFFDTTVKRDKAAKDAEEKLLLGWRRAWWAQGFRPIVLARAEAMKNPMYETFQFRLRDKDNDMEMDPQLEIELVKWLAWEHMGTGILSNYLAIPMAPFEDPLLSYLRRGEYPQLTRYEGLDGGVFSGERSGISAAVKQALDNPDLLKAKSFIEAVPKDAFTVDPSHDGIAFYDMNIINDRYKVVSETYAKSASDGKEALAQLINEHLHSTFQNSFSQGIAVLKPFPAHMTTLVEPALQIADLLGECSSSPMPTSCPPNKNRCNPCASAHRLQITTPSMYRNKTGLYTIGTVPHPYTLTSLMSQREELDARFVRRETTRDQWIFQTTKEYLGTGVSGLRRIIKFKEAVAGEDGTAHSLWLIPEKEPPTENLEWYFGFKLPVEKSNGGVATPPVPGSDPNSRRGERKRQGTGGPADPIPTAEELKQEQGLLVKAKESLKSSNKPQQVIKGTVEAWSLADTEAWKFVRAFRARSKVERMKWEEEEKQFNGGVGVEGRGSALSRWFD